MTGFPIAVRAWASTARTIARFFFKRTALFGRAAHNEQVHAHSGKHELAPEKRVLVQIGMRTV
jgi:hypothetical protein